MSRGSWAVALALLMTGGGCGEAPFVAAPDATLRLSANPESIPADGGVSVISAVVIEPNGTAAPNGTVVQFFTILGGIERQAETRDGVARVNLVADSRSGTAEVTARSGKASAGEAVEVEIGGVTSIVLAADPPRLTSLRYSYIAANVLDANGNPVANVPVIFTVKGLEPDYAVQESLESGGVPLFTDTNGRAVDILYTRAARSGTQRTVEVTARTSNDVSAAVEVIIN